MASPPSASSTPAGRAERSHRTDDEKFYRPYQLQVRDTEGLLEWGALGGCVHRAAAAGRGEMGMGGQSLLAVLKRLGYTGRGEIVLFPPVRLDVIRTYVVFSRDP